MLNNTHLKHFLFNTLKQKYIKARCQQTRACACVVLYFMVYGVWCKYISVFGYIMVFDFDVDGNGMNA